MPTKKCEKLYTLYEQRQVLASNVVYANTIFNVIINPVNLGPMLGDIFNQSHSICSSFVLSVLWQNAQNT